MPRSSTCPVATRRGSRHSPGCARDGARRGTPRAWRSRFVLRGQAYLLNEASLLLGGEEREQHLPTGRHVGRVATPDGTNTWRVPRPSRRSTYSNVDAVEDGNVHRAAGLGAQLVEGGCGCLVQPRREVAGAGAQRAHRRGEPGTGRSPRPSRRGLPRPCVHRTRVPCSCRPRHVGERPDSQLAFLAEAAQDPAAVATLESVIATERPRRAGRRGGSCGRPRRRDRPASRRRARRPPVPRLGPGRGVTAASSTRAA